MKLCVAGPAGGVHANTPVPELMLAPDTVLFTRLYYQRHAAVGIRPLDRDAQVRTFVYLQGVLSGADRGADGRDDGGWFTCTTVMVTVPASRGQHSP